MPLRLLATREPRQAEMFLLVSSQPAPCPSRDTCSFASRTLQRDTTRKAMSLARKAISSLHQKSARSSARWVWRYGVSISKTRIYPSDNRPRPISLQSAPEHFEESQSWSIRVSCGVGRSVAHPRAARRDMASYEVHRRREPSSCTTRRTGSGKGYVDGRYTPGECSWRVKRVNSSSLLPAPIPLLLVPFSCLDHCLLRFRFDHCLLRISVTP
jgi:hypothetical protein